MNKSNQWVSASDMLPPAASPVIGWCVDGDACGRPEIVINVGGDPLLWQYFDKSLGLRVTHWMAPSPPDSSGQMRAGPPYCVGHLASVGQPKLDPETDWPCARLLVRDGKIEATLYAPGLPDGVHDVWCAPVHQAGSL